MKPKQEPSESTIVPTPPPSRPEARTVMSSMIGPRGPISTLHFFVHPAMVELQREAEARGWNAKGFTTLTIAWQELRWSADGWQTTHTVSSTDVPCPIVNGTFHLAGCAPGTNVEFAIRVGLACHAPHDTAFSRDVCEVWLNNDGRNFTQLTR